MWYVDRITIDDGEGGPGYSARDSISVSYGVVGKVSSS
jgi:hypothetical protein